MCLNSSFSLQPATWEHVPRQTDQDPPPAALRLPSPESVTRAGQGGGSPKPLRRRHAHHPRCVSPLVGRRRKVHGCILRRRRSHRRHHRDWRSLRGGAPRDKGFRPARHSGRGAGRRTIRCRRQHTTAAGMAADAAAKEAYRRPLLAGRRLRGMSTPPPDRSGGAHG